MKNSLLRATGLALGAAVAAVALSGPATAVAESRRTLRSLYGLTPPQSVQRSSTALLLIDFQEEFFHGKLPLKGAVAAAEHAVQLRQWAQRQGLLIVHVKNISSRAGSPVFAAGSPMSQIVPSLTPMDNELVVTKSMVGAFSRTDLDATLRSRKIDTLVVAGLMTHLAVQATAIDGAVLGYRVLVASDASATRALPGVGGSAVVDAELLHRVTLASMADRVADVLTSPEIAALEVR